MKQMLRISALFFFLILILCACGNHEIDRIDHCYRSFDDFAYVLPWNEWDDTVLPLSPWEFATPLPKVMVDNVISTTINTTIMTTRFVDGYSEIWLYRSYRDDTDNTTHEFIVYSPDNDGWEIIPAEIDNDTYIYDLFVTDNGTIFGGTYQENNPQSPLQSILSIFNDETRQFEPVLDVSTIPYGVGESYYIEWTQILIDAQGVFWFIVPQTAIYSYDPDSHFVEYHIKLPPDRLLWGDAISEDGLIYIQLHDPASISHEVDDGELYLFSPKTNDMNVIEIPQERWPHANELLVDQSGRLWLGAVGYRDSTGNWTLLHTHIFNYFFQKDWHAPYSWYSDPDVIYQSSDGRIWFQIEQPDGPVLKTGMAWYDPDTGDGCWFTTEASNVVEDSSQNVWIEVNQNLYKYSLVSSENQP